nr:hypothetical protein [Tanacetum cinerariifolium]
MVVSGFVYPPIYVGSCLAILLCPMVYKLSDGPPNISDADRRAKDSNVDPAKEAGTPDDKPTSTGALGAGRADST